MLGPGRYLLGVADLALLAGFAWLGAARVRSRLLPSFEGAPSHLATSVLAAALLIWPAELLGTISLFKPALYAISVVALGLALRFLVGGPPASSEGGAGGGVPRTNTSPAGAPPPVTSAAGALSPTWPTVVALLIAAVAVIHFAVGVKSRLSTGMTGFDSTWYHGPFAAGFFQSGNTIDLHFIAPQFLAWFYPANGEIFPAVGIGAFGRDLLSPLLNLGWFAGCLVACWCIGRAYRVQAWSLGLGAIALSVPALADQAGEARNDLVGIFFLLAAVAVALNAWPGARDEQKQLLGREEGDEGVALGERPWPGAGALAAAGLAAGLAAGTKLNFLLPAAVLVFGLVAIVPRGTRWRALAAAGLAALAGGGYWYLRNLVHTGNPLPWIHHLGPIDLPAPQQALGGREAHSVLGYLTDTSVWSDWFLPGLHQALWIVWPPLAAAALAGLLLCLAPARSSLGRPGVPKEPEPRNDEAETRGSFGTNGGPKEPRNRGWDPVLVIAGLVGLASALAWLIAPTSASGPDGMPKGFESGLRYLAPALILGLALLPTVPLLRSRLSSVGARLSFPSLSAGKHNRAPTIGRPWAVMMGLVLVFLAVVFGYPVQRHYLQKRYADPSFTTPGLNAAFAWSSGISGARIATTSTRQYPLFGTDLSNYVQFIGSERPHGGFEAPTSCRAWREELNKGHYDYVVTSKDRLEPSTPQYPEQARWTQSLQAKVILKTPPTVVFKLTGSLDPSACPS